MSEEEAHEALVKKVGRYFVQYLHIVGLEALKGYIKEAHRLDDAAVTGAIRASLVHFAAKEMVDIVEMALKEMTRAFAVEYGEEQAGALLVPQTIQVRQAGMLAYMTTKGARTGTEYAVLGAIAREVVKMAREYIANADEFTLALGVKELEGNVDKLSRLVKELPHGRVLPQSPYDPPWLRKAYEVLRILRGVEVGARAGEVKRALVPTLSVLYELLSLYLLFEALKDKYFMEPKLERAFKFTKRKGKGSLIVTLNRPPPESEDIITGVDDLSDEEVNKLKGRPDIALAKDRELRVVFECKYSRSPSYITNGRFKLMAYVYEYSLNAGVLVFPSIGEAGPEEEYDRDAVDSIRAALSRGDIPDIRLSDGRRIYLLQVDPMKDDAELVGKMRELAGTLGLL